MRHSWRMTAQKHAPYPPYGKKLIPLCLPGVQHTLVKRLVGQDLLIIEHDPAQPLSLSLPKILAALGKQLPGGLEESPAVCFKADNRRKCGGVCRITRSRPPRP